MQSKVGGDKSRMGRVEKCARVGLGKKERGVKLWRVWKCEHKIWQKCGRGKEKEKTKVFLLQY